MGIVSDHFNDAGGNPAGGITWGRGLTIAWQNGPVKEPNVAANGAFVEDVIEAAIDRIGYYQASRFACDENAEALEHLRAALAAMNRRTSRRLAAGVEGTHKGN